MRRRSRIIPGPRHLRYYPAHRLVAWRPVGVLNDQVVDEIAGWVVGVEKFSLPFARYVDLSRLSHVSLDLEHVSPRVELCLFALPGHFPSEPRQLSRQVPGDILALTE